MKKIFLFLLVALISLYAASAACADQRACQNQDNDFYCSPGDSSCQYVHFTQSLTCTVDTGYTDSDSDGDHWTDNCDAFPADVLEWFDMDGDGYGHVYDCDDFDKTIGENCDPDGDGETNEEEHDHGTNPNENNNSGSGGGSKNFVTLCSGQWDCSEWSVPKDKCGTRTCVNTNSCNSNKPNEEQACPNYVVLKPNVEATKEPVVVPEIKVDKKEEVPPAEDTTGNRLTGQVFNTEPGNFKPASLFLLLIIIAGLLGFFFWKRKKKEQQLYSF
jgi:hypothetical protein